MTKQISLDTLWDSATSQDRLFHLDDFTHLPEAAKRYLEHAIAPGTKIASAVRLKMHGEIKLKKWIPFTAEQVICWEHGLIWSATGWMNGFLPIVGSDYRRHWCDAVEAVGIIPCHDGEWYRSYAVWYWSPPIRVSVATVGVLRRWRFMDKHRVIGSRL